MKNSLYLALVVLVCGITACTHSSTSRKVTGEYMVIGRGGFMPAKVTYYFLSGSSLLADTTASNGEPPAPLGGFQLNVSLPSSKHAAVKDVLVSIPSELLSRNHAMIGVPPVTDGGITIVGTSINGVLYEWRFHDDLGNTSSSIRDFVAKLQVVF